MSQHMLAPDSINVLVTVRKSSRTPANPAPLQPTRPRQRGLEGKINSFFSVAICLAGHAGLILVLLSLLLLPRIYDFSPSVPVCFPSPVKTTSAGIYGLSVC